MKLCRTAVLWKEHQTDVGFSYHTGCGACRMWTDVRVSDKASPFLPAGGCVDECEPSVMQPVWINTLYQIKKGQCKVRSGYTGLKSCHMTQSDHTPNYWLFLFCTLCRRNEDVTFRFSCSPASCDTRPGVIQVIILIRDTNWRHFRTCRQSQGTVKISQTQWRLLRVKSPEGSGSPSLAALLRWSSARLDFGGKPVFCGGLKTLSTRMVWTGRNLMSWSPKTATSALALQ